MLRDWKFTALTGVGGVLALTLLAACPQEPGKQDQQDAPGGVPEHNGPPPNNPPPPVQAQPDDVGAENNAVQEGSAEGQAVDTVDAGAGTDPKKATTGAPIPPPDDGSEPPEIRFREFPQEVTTQKALRASQSFVTIKGTLSGDECAKKKFRIEAQRLNDDGMPMPATLMFQDGTGPFEMLLPKGNKEYWIMVICDANSDDKISIDADMHGAFSGNPVKAGKDTNGVNITVSTQPPTPEDGMPPDPNYKSFR